MVDEVPDELRVVHHLVVAAQLGVFVFEHVEAVGAACDDAFHFVTVEHRNVLCGLHLEQELVSGTLGGIACAAFFGAEDCKRHLAVVKDAGNGFGDALGAIVKASCTPHPKQHFRGLALGGHFRQRRDLKGAHDSGFVRPIATTCRRESQGAPLFSMLLNMVVMDSGDLLSSMIRLRRMSSTMPMGEMLKDRLARMLDKTYTPTVLLR